MRVVAGSARGMRLLTVPGDGTRPIMDRVKTSLFDVLRPRISDMDVLDLFAGSGSVGIEALSQGAARCTFLDTGRRAIETIRKNLEITGFSDRAVVRHADAFEFLRTTSQAFDLIFVAPPQFRDFWAEAMNRIAERPELLRSGLPESEDEPEPEPGMVIAQIDAKEYRPLALGEISEVRQRRYGTCLLVFYEKSVPERPGADSTRRLNDGLELNEREAPERATSTGDEVDECAVARFENEGGAIGISAMAHGGTEPS